MQSPSLVPPEKLGVLKVQALYHSKKYLRIFDYKNNIAASTAGTW